MKLNLQKTTAAVLAVLLSAGVFAANNANAFEYGYKNHKYGKKWGKPASEAEGERVMKKRCLPFGRVLHQRKPHSCQSRPQRRENRTG